MCLQRTTDVIAEPFVEEKEVRAENKCRYLRVSLVIRAARTFSLVPSTSSTGGLFKIALDSSFFTLQTVWLSNLPTLSDHGAKVIVSYGPMVGLLNQCTMKSCELPFTGNSRNPVAV